MDNKRSFPLLLSSFWLKIIALFTMTIDHIGYLMQYYGVGLEVANVFRIIGRFALPLFCFMIFEGVTHTKNFNKYALRLGILASAVCLALIAMETLPIFINNGISMRDQGNIFIDLLLGAFAVYLLKQQKWYFKLLAILPLGYGVASYIASCLESCGCHGEILWMPYFLRTQYGWYGIALIVGFYVSYLLATLFIKSMSLKTSIPEESYKGSNLERNAINIISICVLAIITIALFYITNSIPFKYRYFDYEGQLYAIIAGAFILLYNGYRGYNKKWFQYGCYLYYAIHLPLLAAIFVLLDFLAII